MPINYKEYSKDWKAISARVRQRNKGRCELCFAPNKMVVIRDNNYIHPWSRSFSGCFPEAKNTKIILTVHHINGDKKDNSELNLISLCQRCHLKLDMATHSRNRKISKHKNQLKMELEND